MLGQAGSLQLHQLCCHLLQADIQEDFLTSRKTSWLHGRLLCWPPDLVPSCFLACSNLKCLAQNFLSPETSISSYNALVFAIFVSSPMSLSLFPLPSLVRAKFLSHTQASRVDISPSSHRHCIIFPWLRHEFLCWVTLSGHIPTIMYTIHPGQQQPSFFRKPWTVNLHLLCNVLQTLYFLPFPTTYLL